MVPRMCGVSLKDRKYRDELLSPLGIEYVENKIQIAGQVSILSSGVCNGAPQSHTGAATIPYLCMSAANLAQPDSSQLERDHEVRLRVPFRRTRCGEVIPPHHDCSHYDCFQLSKTKRKLSKTKMPTNVFCWFAETGQAPPEFTSSVWAACWKGFLEASLCSTTSTGAKASSSSSSSFIFKTSIFPR